jgi:type I restriction enzyme M protein
MKPVDEGGSRIAIVVNGSPLFAGVAGSGESVVRRWLSENDWLDAIVGLPDQMFYNTGIYTYFWIVTNRKPIARRGKIQLIDARPFYSKLQRSMGNKRNEFTDADIARVVDLYVANADNENSKVLPNEAFGYNRITVEQPLRVRYEVLDEGLETLKVAKPFIALAVPRAGSDDLEVARERGEKAQRDILAGLASLIGYTTTDQAKFAARLTPILDGAGDKLPAPALASIWQSVTITDPEAPIIRDRKGRAKPDPELRDTEAEPLMQDIQEFMSADVLPDLPEAWYDPAKTKVGYGIPFGWHFYRYVPPRAIEDIDAEIATVEKRILELLGDQHG